MLLDARLLTNLQGCPRKHLLAATYEVIHWRPRTLFDACLRVGVRQVSEGLAGGEAAKEMSARYMQEAANPGLDLPRGTDAYKLAKDYCAMLGTILRAAEKWKLPRLGEALAAPLGETHKWQPLAFEATGELHRIVTCDKWDEREMSRELHGWYVLGDIAATGKEMIVHVVEIGRTRKGRRASPWARGWKHPSMPSLKMRFVNAAGKEFKSWKPIYLAEYPHSNVQMWVEQMYEEGIAQSLTHEVRVSAPAERVRMDTLRQMEMEASRAEGLGGTAWAEMPMSRGACDDRISPCPWQHACHQEINRLEDTGLYVIRDGSSIKPGKMLVA